MDMLRKRECDVEKGDARGLRGHPNNTFAPGRPKPSRRYCNLAYFHACELQAFSIYVAGVFLRSISPKNFFYPGMPNFHDNRGRLVIYKLFTRKSSMHDAALILAPYYRRLRASYMRNMRFSGRQASAVRKPLDQLIRKFSHLIMPVRDIIKCAKNVWL